MININPHALSYSILGVKLDMKLPRLHWAARFFIFSLFLFTLQSCNTTKYLHQGEYLLDNNKIVIKAKVNDKSELEEELATFYRQQPNTNWFILFPRERLYFKAALKNKETKWSKWKLKTIGEQPSIYSDSLTTTTALDMQKHLKYNGYLNATVIPQRAPRKQKMSVAYYVLPGTQYKVDSVSFHSSDPKINSFLNQEASNSHFKPNQPLDLSLFNQEKLRISSLLKNKGYAEFYPTYIDDLEVDTFQIQNKANLYINVLPPYGDSVHQQYYIGDINVFFGQTNAENKIVKDTLIGGVNFFLTERGFIVNSSTLRRAISLRFGERYSQTAYDRTFDQLSELGMFRFVRIKQVPDIEQSDVIHFNIQLTPNYKMEFSANLDLNYANAKDNTTSAKNLIGVSLNPNLVNRNLLGGAELFSSGIRAGVEMAPSNIGTGSFWNTIDLGADFSLLLPKFVDYLGIWKGLYNIKTGKDKHFLNKKFYSALKQKANTRLNVNYQYSKIINSYRYNLATVSYGFDFKPDRNTNYNVNHFAVNYFDPITEPAFDSVLVEKEFLARSFGEQVFVSILFRDLDFIKTSRTVRKGKSYFFNGNIETAGAEILGANRLYNWISGNKNKDWYFADSVEISQYVRLETDVRFLKQVTSKQAFAARFNLGIARPFGNTEDVPYVKQYFVGGANSMRGWSPRSLGPGGYLDPKLDSLLRLKNVNFYQTGDLKMELNVEYRLPLFLWFNLALFVDVGNVWTIEKDPQRPGSQFVFKQSAVNSEDVIEQYPFYKQLAVNSGVGLRVDLSYFIFRFDVGVKMRRPYPNLEDNKLPSESAWWVKPNEIALKSTNINYNFGLGFPF